MQEKRGDVNLCNTPGMKHSIFKIMKNFSNLKNKEKEIAHLSSSLFPLFKTNCDGNYVDVGGK